MPLLAASELSNLFASSGCSTSLRQCDVVVTSPQVRLRLTSGYHKLDGYAARGAYHSLIKLYVGILRTFFYCFHPILCLIVGEWGCVRRLPWEMGMKKRAAFLL